ncbi:MAG: tRNA dihydrouridine synthase DusB [Oscillospiraceae bacterium]|jgi:tRNA-dihydrouridine synthase B|nr:tRNA dihydrouridine synthase DusB [Oscillospiraceae bacterium]
MQIGNVQIESNIFLAPMAGVTDLAFREVCRAMGAGLCATEMVSAKALVYQDSKTKTLLETSPADHPVAAQIFGSEPDTMARAAQLALKHSGADIVDINMGCPVGKIVNNSEGSALMLRPDLARAIIEAVVAAVDVPVTVKFRRGYDKGNLNCVEFAEMCERAGAAAVAVHGRTRSQGYSGTADWFCIRDVVRAVSIPVVGNGDVFSGADAARMLELTGCAAVMIGRGAFGNPWIFREAAAAIAGAEPPPRPTLREIIATATRQIERAAELRGEKLACLDARRHLSWYTRGLRGAGRLRGDMVRVSTLDDVRGVLARLTEL